MSEARPPAIRYGHIISAILAQPWAIDRDSAAWGAICDVLALRAAGETLRPDEIAAAIEIAAASNGDRAGGRRSGTVAIVPVYGVISPRMSSVQRTSGGTSAEGISAAFSAAVRDPEVDGIVLDIDSPGGNVQGIAELAAEIRAARGQKPISAVANHSALSAAYWIASAADEIVATESARVGSIGVISAHQDLSAAQEKAGIRTTVIAAGKYKGEANEFAPLTDEARAAIQADADTYYQMFTSAVAKGRGVPVDTVRSGFGEGRSILAKAGLGVGMVDRVDTFENTLRRVARGSVTSKAVDAPATPPAGALEEGDASEAGVQPPADPPPSALRVSPGAIASRRMREAALEAGIALD